MAKTEYPPVRFRLSTEPDNWYTMDRVKEFDERLRALPPKVITRSADDYKIVQEA